MRPVCGGTDKIWSHLPTAEPAFGGVAKLFNHEEVADGEGVDAGAIKAADGFARVGDEWFAEKIEGSVEEDGRGGVFAKFVEQTPETRVGIALDGVNADLAFLEGKAL